MGWTYKDAGVDVEAGYKAVSLMKKYVSNTLNENVLGGIGSFSGLYSLDIKEIGNPVLVSGTDGVGTKLKLAFELEKHDTIGQDCVAMCVNDIICQGAQPLFFLDYIATGRLEPEKIAQIVKGVSEGCIQASCALIGGETAEMPGFYNEGEYDIAGFAVGIVDRKKIIDGSNIKKGNVIIGIESSGLHSNGYSLVRKLVIDDKYRLNEYYDCLGCTVGEELIKPTRIYTKCVMDILKEYSINGIAHITGGGFIENIPRVLPKGLQAKIHIGSWPIRPIFSMLQEWGNIKERDMYNTFNMGIGLVMICRPEIVKDVVASSENLGFPAHIIGKVVDGDEGVVLCR